MSHWAAGLGYQVWLEALGDRHHDASVRHVDWLPVAGQQDPLTPKNGKQGSSILRGWDFQSNTRRGCGQKMVICLLSERFRCALLRYNYCLLFRFFSYCRSRRIMCALKHE